MIKRSKKARERARVIAELDALARAAVFERDDNKCVRCGRKDGKLDWAHIISRQHLCTRWEPYNALVLCFTCHRWWHDYPSLSGPWFVKNWPERREHVHTIYNNGGKVTIADMKALLEATR